MAGAKAGGSRTCLARDSKARICRRKNAGARCNGSAAVPTLVAQNPYTPDPNLVLPAGQSSPPIMSASCRLGNNGEFYYHAYAMLTLKGKAADISYYQIPGDDAARELIFVEQIPAD